MYPIIDVITHKQRTVTIWMQPYWARCSVRVTFRRLRNCAWRCLGTAPTSPDPRSSSTARSGRRAPSTTPWWRRSSTTASSSSNCFWKRAFRWPNFLQSPASKSFTIPNKVLHSLFQLFSVVRWNLSNQNYLWLFSFTYLLLPPSSGERTRICAECARTILAVPYWKLPKGWVTSWSLTLTCFKELLLTMIGLRETNIWEPEF